MREWESVEYGPFRTDDGVARLRVYPTGLRIAPRPPSGSDWSGLRRLFLGGPPLFLALGLAYDNAIFGIMGLVGIVLLFLWMVRALVRSLRAKGRSEQLAPWMIPVEEIRSIGAVSGTILPAFVVTTAHGTLTVRAPAWKAGELRQLQQAARAVVGS